MSRKNNDLAQGLASTLLNLRPSELRQAQEVRPGENRPDLIIGSAAEVPAPEAPAPAIAAPGPVEAATTPIASAPAIVKPAARRAAPPSKPKGFKFQGEQRRSTEIPLRVDQLELLHGLEVSFGVRAEVRGRLSKAAIVRALVDVLPYLDIERAEFTDEASLKQRIFEKLGLDKLSKAA